MNKKFFTMLLVVLMTMTALAGCGKKEKSGVEGQTYKDSKHKFSLTVPENWDLKGSEETYEYLVSNGAAKDVESLKSTLKAQKVDYLCIATDPQTSVSGGNDNIILQTMPDSLFGDIEVTEIITSITALFKQQFTVLGAETTMSEPVKSVVNGQDVYQVSATISYEGEDTVLKQEYIIFMRKGSLIYMILTTSKEDSAAFADQFIDGIEFK